MEIIAAFLIAGFLDHLLFHKHDVKPEPQPPAISAPAVAAQDSTEKAAP